MSRKVWLSVTLGVGMFGLGSMALAATDPQCILTAREAYNFCKAECRADFRAEKFRCRNVEPACGLRCLAGREACTDPINDILDQCIGDCKAQLQAGKDMCRQDCGTNQACLDDCIDRKQVDAFICKDNCRENFRANYSDDLENCRSLFRACVAACPPAQP